MPVDVRAISQVVTHLQKAIREMGAGPPSLSTPFSIATLSREKLVALYDIHIQHEGLRSTTRKLFVDRHYARAVEEAYKYLNNMVKAKSGLSIDGKSLMDKAFSLNNPVLRINRLRSESEKDEQLGYMLIFGGCMTGIRNPRAHEHEIWDSPDRALEMLVLAKHLACVVDKSKRVRRRRKQASG